jgi:hypothetical protein
MEFLRVDFLNLAEISNMCCFHSKREKFRGGEPVPLALAWRWLAESMAVPSILTLASRFRKWV